MPSILLVCSANICRSPLAEAILRQIVANRHDADQWRIASAGTWARFGAPAAELSQIVAQDMGMDLSQHRSQPVTLELIQGFDLILTMEHQQKEGLLLAYKTHARRVYMLSEMVGRVEDIPDPIGGELADYQATANLMRSYLSEGLGKIYQTAIKFGPIRPE
jgi:protein-tyrosine phosphatase